MSDLLAEHVEEFLKAFVVAVLCLAVVVTMAHGNKNR